MLAEATELQIQHERRLTWAGRLIPTISATPFLALGIWAWTEGGDMVIVSLFMAMMLFFLLCCVLVGAPAGLVFMLKTLRGGAQDVSVTEEGLTVSRPDGKATHIPHADLGLAWAHNERDVRVITRKGDELRILLRSPKDTANLLTALRHAEIHNRAYRVPNEPALAGLIRKSLGGGVPLSIGSIALAFGPWGLIPFSAGLGLAWAAMRGDANVQFGADGFLIKGRFRTRYISYRDVHEVQIGESVPGAQLVRVKLQDENAKPIRIGWLIGSERARLLKSLIEEGVEMAKSGRAAGAEVAELARGADDDAAWRERVANAAKNRGYRGAALESVRLISLMRNPAADPEQRVAAALALRVEPDGPTRIKAAAEASSEPEVRRALEELSTDEMDPQRLDRLIRRIARSDAS